MEMPELMRVIASHLDKESSVKMLRVSKSWWFVVKSIYSNICFPSGPEGEVKTEKFIRAISPKLYMEGFVPDGIRWAGRYLRNLITFGFATTLNIFVQETLRVGKKRILASSSPPAMPKCQMTMKAAKYDKPASKPILSTNWTPNYQYGQFIRSLCFTKMNVSDATICAILGQTKSLTHLRVNFCFFVTDKSYLDLNQNLHQHYCIKIGVSRYIVSNENYEPVTILSLCLRKTYQTLASCRMSLHFRSRAN
jgi:hypothetical protein